MTSRGQHALAIAIEAGEQVAHAELASRSTDERDLLRIRLMTSPIGRHWLRADPDLDTALADQLLGFETDFRQSRRDRTLVAVIRIASPAAIERHAAAVAAGPAAPELWQRLRVDHATLVTLASTSVAGADRQSAESTLHLLVLDPLDPYQLGAESRGAVALHALSSAFPEVRGLAAEYLATHDPAALQRSLDLLLGDESERVRGIIWDAALRVDRAATLDRAVALLSDEVAPVNVRRSALVALGDVLPTSQMANLLSYFVVHPDHDLAADAAELLFRQHRNPITAEAARDSPHADVREVAERLLDPMRGSPAAGGSRPGDPTRSSTDIYADMIKQLEDKADNQNPTDQR